VVFTPAAAGLVNGTLAINASVAVTGSPVALSGTGVVAVRPTPAVLDNFDRANATTLNNGANWSQVIAAGAAADRVNTFQATCVNAGLLTCALNGAIWNAPTAGFGNRQAAVFTVANTTVNGDSLILKASAGTATTPVNFIRVNLTGTTVVVSTTQTAGVGTTSSTTLSNANSTFTTGDILTAMVDQNGVLLVWKNATFVGGVTLPNVALWTSGSGRIGMQLPVNARVDNFAGGTVP
jgi:hypothetical protein